jgi:hypothetical protein
MTKMNYNRPVYRTGTEVKKEESTKPVEMRVYLMVSYRDKDFIKKLGASWNPSHIFQQHLLTVGATCLSDL